MTDDVMLGAVNGGHKAIVLLGRAWGATRLDSALTVAAKCGHEDLVRLLKSWGRSRL